MGGRAPSPCPAWPPGLLAAVFACDLLRDHRVRSRAVTGVLDEVAHLSTTGLALLALRDRAWLERRRGDVAVALAASVLVDLDHVRLPVGSASVVGGGRSIAHSVTSVAAALLVSAAAPAPWDRRSSAAAAGLTLHFARDVATGYGLRLWWPVHRGVVKVHYGAYAAACTAAALAGVERLRRGSRRPGMIG